jgi:hypothetical protein
LLITLIALWTYPILTFFVFRLGRRYNNLKTINLTIATILVLTTLFLTFDISTTSIEVDWILLTTYYFGLCFLLWSVVHLKAKLFKILGYIIMTFVFGLGYFSGTIGILGVGFVTGGFVPRKQNKIESNLTYKETGLGNAFSDYRGVRVELYKTYKYLPFIERRISTNAYYGMELAVFPIVQTYDKETKTLSLTLDIPDDKKDKFGWSQKISIE